MPALPTQCFQSTMFLIIEKKINKNTCNDDMAYTLKSKQKQGLENLHLTIDRKTAFSPPPPFPHPLLNL